MDKRNRHEFDHRLHIAIVQVHALGLPIDAEHVYKAMRLVESKTSVVYGLRRAARHGLITGRGTYRLGTLPRALHPFELRATGLDTYELTTRWPHRDVPVFVGLISWRGGAWSGLLPREITGLGLPYPWLYLPLLIKRNELCPSPR